MQRVQPLAFLLKAPTPAQKKKHREFLQTIADITSATVFASVAKITTENRDKQQAAFANQLAFLMHSFPPSLSGKKERREELVERLNDAALAIQCSNPETPPTPWELLAWTSHSLAIPGGASLYALSTSFIRVARGRGPESVALSAMQVGIWGQNAIRWTRWIANGKPSLRPPGRPPNMVFSAETGQVERQEPTLDGPWCDVYERVKKKYGPTGWGVVLDYIEGAEELGAAYHENWTARKGSR